MEAAGAVSGSACVKSRVCGISGATAIDSLEKGLEAEGEVGGAAYASGRKCDRRGSWLPNEKTGSETAGGGTSRM